MSILYVFFQQSRVNKEQLELVLLKWRSTKSTKISFLFYAEARNKEGDKYSELLAFRNGIERYLNTPPNNLGVRPSQDPRFLLSNKIVYAKTFERDGLQSITQKPTIEQHYLAKIKQSDVLSLTKSSSLLRIVWFHVSFYWFRRGLQGQRNLKKLRSFSFQGDATDHPFVTMTRDKATKNHREGETTEVESIEVSKTSAPNDAYSFKCLLYDRG